MRDEISISFLLFNFQVIILDTIDVNKQNKHKHDII